MNAIEVTTKHEVEYTTLEGKRELAPAGSTLKVSVDQAVELDRAGALKSKPVAQVKRPDGNAKPAAQVTRPKTNGKTE